uniref:Sodium/hydrogen exchanger (TC.KEF) n=3 Tax=environmental samples TaxID=651140 RepID=A0A075IBH3_9ARCH|nr:sodium/hydrogen exchanger (TC.KEF) [uncultured marine thaumarchaeote SAT1000_25_G11]AIF24197.1 sodium/hydrogen exchanger (TC.KEF) [uncultured marine thaumarchaeote SAT1000_25_G12]AIF25135.1 sodium/hydrogen exchanger (TC.KEF) [uncultured marine thaumarchaeote SAT1000_47_G01]
MKDFFLQIQSQDSVKSSLSENISTFVERVNPLQLPHETFVTDLAIIMILAAIVTLAFFKIRQPLIIGYLFAGMLIGPLSPLWTSILPQNGSSGPAAGIGILSDISALNLFADIGVILLLFVIGIEFPFAKIRSIGRVAVGAGTLGLFATLGVVFLAASALGLNFMDSLFIAAALSISSTAIIVKILQDSGKIKKESSILILGILIVEDVIAVILIASLESVALAGTVSVEAVVLVAVVAGGLIVGTFTIGRRVIPPLIDKVAGAQNREILLLSVLGVCFGYALLANVVGLSVAIGAFLAGVLVAESKSSEVSKILSSPIKDMFVAIFFVSVGALMDVTQLEDYIFIAIALIAVTIAMKFGGNLLGTTAFRMGKGKSLRSAFALSAPRGEFSIVIVKVGVDMGVVSAFLFPLIGLITIITAFISPFLIRLGDRIIPKLSKS